MPDPTATSFGLLALLFFGEFVEKDKFVHIFLSGVFFAISILIKPFLVFYSIPMLYLLFNKYSVKKIFSTPRLLIKLLLFVDIVWIPFLLWRTWIIKFPEGIPEWKWMFNGDGIRFRPSFWRWLFAERLGNLILGMWGLIPLAFGLIKRSKSAFKYFFSLGIILYLSIFATVNVRHDYYQLIAIPIISLLLSEGVLFMWNIEKRSLLSNTWTRIVLMFSLVMMFGIGWYQVKEFYKINHPEIIEAGAYVDEHVPKDAWVIAPYDGDTAFLYQTKRKGWPVIDNSLENLIERGADYYVSVNLNDTDTSNISKKYEVLEKNDKFILIDLHKPI